MNLNTFIVNVFCETDDFMKKYFPKRTLRARGPMPQLADSEVLTIEIVGEILGFDTDKDIFGFSSEGIQAYISLFRMRKGKVIESEIIAGEMNTELSVSEFLASKLIDYYSERKDIPEKIILPFRLENPDKLDQLLSRLKSKKVKLMTPIKGENRKRFILCLIDDCTRMAWAELIPNIKSLTVMFATLKSLNILNDHYKITKN